MKHIANILTASRIITALILLFTAPFSKWFYVLYCLCGLTDIADGYAARRTGTASNFGAKLDSAADICFVLVCLIKLLPVIELGVRLWVWIAGIALIRAANIVFGLAFRHRLIMLHTAANRAAGFLLFLLPFLLPFVRADCVCIPACAAAAFAAVQEGHLIRTNR